VAVHSETGEVQSTRSESDLRYPIYLTSQNVSESWNVTQYPTTYVLDSEGRIVARDTGYSPGWELRRLALKALPEP